LTRHEPNPGWRFLEGVGRKLPKGGSVVGFVAPNGNDISLVIETTEAQRPAPLCR